MLSLAGISSSTEVGASENSINHAVAHSTSRFFLHLLDAHNVGQEAGVSEEMFKAIFYTCYCCGRYMTQRMAFQHHDEDEFCDDESDTESLNSDSAHRYSPNLKSCIYLREEGRNIINPRKYREKHLYSRKNF